MKYAHILIYFSQMFLDAIGPPQVRELGFDGYAIDFVDCPQAMRRFLMRECQLHRTVRLLLSSHGTTLICGAGHRSAAQPRRCRPRHAYHFPHWWRELRRWQHHEHGYAFAVRTAAAAESYARRTAGARPRGTCR
jgi:hypothetical protein